MAALYQREWTQEYGCPDDHETEPIDGARYRITDTRTHGAVPERRYALAMVWQEKTDTTSGESLSIAKGDAFHLLKNPRRRAVVRYLLARDDQETVRMATVTEAVAAWEHDTTVERLTSKERQRVYIGLYQTHLPKLDAHGVIEYNSDRGWITPTPLLQVFAPYVTTGLPADDTESELTVTDDERTETSLAAAVSSIFHR